MGITKHCELCDHQQVNLIDGSTCGLTNKKPAFHRTCSKIKLSSKFKAKLEAYNVQYESIKRTKVTAFIYLAVFLLVSAAVFFLAYMLAQKVSNVRYIGVFIVVPIIICAIGGYLILMAFRPLATYRKEMEVAKKNKETIDAILSLYNIRYTFTITFGEKIHGEQQYTSSLDIKGIR